MMINANLMLMVVLLWAGTLPVASPKNYPFMLKRQTPDCEKYVLPINAMWEPTCDENKRFKCKKGYELIVQTTCKNGGWTLEPTCEAAGCPQGEIITNSDVVTESRTLNEDFSFDCSVGFTQNGVTGMLRCDENGTWIEQKACQALECPQGEIITNSDDVTESRTFNEDFRFECSVGFTQNGVTGILRCDENGTWTEQKACQAVECPQGENITLSDDVTESSIVGGLFNFSCSVGFVETGTLRCEENGTWTEQKACQVVRKAVVNKGLPKITFARNCKRDCATTPGCGFTLSVSGICKTYKKPLIYFHRFTQGLSQCIQKCKDEPSCLTMSYSGPPLFVCNLYNANFTTLQNTDGLEVVNNGIGTVVEKSGFDFVNTP
ncbi:hypothetical protein LOTGIDRAFT_173261 [Lottia gigantea]|uniref:Sushi domain-containing protein n=1 Tax=Lottia gigantea TaxID=225164 RepID=V4ASY2_LOTGI|nr:hypothetical protein LOTGIDRAFT_173261 [Lottia gigantea]ESP00358.1 hypothetical protein LOTGIDRAFT_173261 [Lottia gigantea]